MTISLRDGDFHGIKEKTLYEHKRTGKVYYVICVTEKIKDPKTNIWIPQAIVSYSYRNEDGLITIYGRTLEDFIKKFEPVNCYQKEKHKKLLSETTKEWSE